MCLLPRNSVGSAVELTLQRFHDGEVADPGRFLMGLYPNLRENAVCFQKIVDEIRKSNRQSTLLVKLKKLILSFHFDLVEWVLGENLEKVFDYFVEKNCTIRVRVLDEEWNLFNCGDTFFEVIVVGLERNVGQFGFQSAVVSGTRRKNGVG